MQVCSAGGKDWGIFQFRVAPIPKDAPPPPKPKAVWGPLDPQGGSQADQPFQTWDGRVPCYTPCVHTAPA